MASYDETRTAIDQIKDETAKNANTANRVGAAMGLMADRIMKDSGTITLLASAWSANTYAFARTGVVASNVVLVGADPSVDANVDLYDAAGIRGTTNGTDVINFKCDTVPVEDVNVNIAIF